MSSLSTCNWAGAINEVESSGSGAEYILLKARPSQVTYYH